MQNTNYSRAARERASSLPDSDFDAHPDVVALRTELAAATEAHTAAVTRRAAASTDGLRVELERLNKEIEQRRSALPKLALDSLLAGDQTFEAAIETRAELQRMTWRVEAVRDAIEGHATHIDGPLYREVGLAASRGSDLGTQLRETLDRLKLDAAQAMV